MTKKTILIELVLFSMFFSINLGMNFIIGGGYKFSSEKFQPAGWNVNLGFADLSGDEILFDVTFNLNATTTSNPSSTDYLLFDLDAYFPLWGRQKDSKLKAGPFLSIEYGNFQSHDSTEVSWNSTAGVGAYVTYKDMPWEITLSFAYPINGFSEFSSENLIDIFELRTRFFISSFYKNFIDEFFIELCISSSKRKISISFSEPF